MKPATPHRRASAFTLIELLVVIVVIAILAGLVLRAATILKTRAAVAQCKTEMVALSAAVESYYKATGAYPVDVNALLTELIGKGKKYIDWPATRIANGKFLDPWGKAYEYTGPTGIHHDANPNQTAEDVIGLGAVCFTFKSYGPDGVVNSADDISSNNLKDN